MYPCYRDPREAYRKLVPGGKLVHRPHDVRWRCGYNHVSHLLCQCAGDECFAHYHSESDQCRAGGGACFHRVGFRHHRATTILPISDSGATVSTDVSSQGINVPSRQLAPGVGSQPEWSFGSPRR